MCVCVGGGGGGGGGDNKFWSSKVCCGGGGVGGRDFDYLRLVLVEFGTFSLKIFSWDILGAGEYNNLRIGACVAMWV